MIDDLSPSPQIEVLSSPNLHDLQVYGVLVTVVLCLVVFGMTVYTLALQRSSSLNNKAKIPNM